MHQLLRIPRASARSYIDAALVTLLVLACVLTLLTILDGPPALFREQIVPELRFRSQIVGDAVAVPLAFRDTDTAERIVGALKLLDRIQGACLYTSDAEGGRLFVSLEKTASYRCAGRVNERVSISADLVEYVSEIRVNEHQLGWLIVARDLVDVRGRQRIVLASAVTLLLASAIVIVGKRAKRIRDEVAIREHIAADLHDNVGASLARISLLSDLLRQRPPADHDHVVLIATAIGVDARGIMDEMLDAIWYVESAGDVDALSVRIREVASRVFTDTNTMCETSADVALTSRRLPMETRRHVFLFVKESLTNIRRHSNATSVKIVISGDRRLLRIEITDNGIGIAVPDERRDGGGLSNMRRRAAMLGGTCAILPGSGGGTTVLLSIPIATRWWHQTRSSNS